jgi:hypothetical protein
MLTKVLLDVAKYTAHGTSSSYFIGYILMKLSDHHHRCRHSFHCHCHMLCPVALS